MKSVAIFMTMLLFQTAWAEMGFFAADDVRVPQVIREASNSVVQVIVPQSETFAVYDRDQYATESFKEFLRSLQDRKMILQSGQIQFCMENNLPVCVVYDDISISTGFVVFDEYHIATNRHADEAYLLQVRIELAKRGYSEKEIFATFRQYPVPMKIARGLKVLKDLGSKHLAFMRWFDAAPPFLADAHGLDYLASDLILIRTEKPISKPLPISRVTSQPGDRIYLVGYPSMTDNRRRDYGVGDSLGIDKISISTGVVKSTEESFYRIQSLGSRVRQLGFEIANDLRVGQENLRFKWSQIVFGDADSEYGGSGSPYLNRSGEVVGLHSTKLLEYRGRQPSLAVSMGVRWPWQKFPDEDFATLKF